MMSDLGKIYGIRGYNDKSGITGMVNANGCIDASKIIPKVYRQLMRQIGMKEVYAVPIRKNGMTGSGIKGHCHGNAIKLQLTYGGKVVLGFLVEKNKNELILLHHSVWMTPEGKLVDITLNWKDEKIALFAPIKKYDATKIDWILNYSFFVPKRYKKRGLMLGCGNGKIDKPVRFSNINKNVLVKDERPISRILDDLNGGFTRPSSATGKSWEDIWSKRMMEF